MRNIIERLQFEWKWKEKVSERSKIITPPFDRRSTLTAFFWEVFVRCHPIMNFRNYTSSLWVEVASSSLNERFINLWQPRNTTTKRSSLKQNKKLHKPSQWQREFNKIINYKCAFSKNVFQATTRHWNMKNVFALTLLISVFWSRHPVVLGFLSFFLVGGRCNVLPCVVFLWLIFSKPFTNYREHFKVKCHNVFLYPWMAREILEKGFSESLLSRFLHLWMPLMCFWLTTHLVNFTRFILWTS